MIFTVVLPTYNNGNYIRESIESALKQTFNHEYEVLVVNNNSTDNTREILSAFGESIHVINHTQTVSLIENHNICLREARGDYVIFCHSDDRLLPDALRNYHAKLQQRNFPDRYVLWGKSIFRDFQRSWAKTGKELDQIVQGPQALNAFMHGGLTPSGTCFSRKSFIEAGGYINTDTTLAPSDMISMWRLVLAGFLFEMSKTRFFTREYASTANNLTRQKLLQSKIIAFRNFREASTLREIKIMKEHISKIKSINMSSLWALRQNNLISTLNMAVLFLRGLAKEKPGFFT